MAGVHIGTKWVQYRLLAGGPPFSGGRGWVNFSMGWGPILCPLPSGSAHDVYAYICIIY